MHRTLILTVLALAAIGLAVAQAASESGRKDNAARRGFLALFKGKELNGWQGVVDMKKRSMLTPEQLTAEQQKANEKFLPHWTVEDGVIHYDGKGNSLQTIKD